MHTTIANYWESWLEEREFFRRMCNRWLRGNSRDVDDVLGRGALNGFEHVRRRPDGIRRFRPWMLKILYHLAIDATRERRRFLDVEPREGGEGDAGDAACAREAPDHALLRAQLAASIAGAVEQLPPKLYVVFTLRFVEHMAYDEISQTLRISESSARKRIQLAREFLRGELAAFAC